MFFDAAMPHTAFSRSSKRGEKGCCASFACIMMGYTALVYLFVFIMGLFAAISMISGVSVSVSIIILILVLVAGVIIKMKYQ